MFILPQSQSAPGPLYPNQTPHSSSWAQTMAIPVNKELIHQTHLFISKDLTAQALGSVENPTAFFFLQIRRRPHSIHPPPCKDSAPQPSPTMEQARQWECGPQIPGDRPTKTVLRVATVQGSRHSSCTTSPFLHSAGPWLELACSLVYVCTCARLQWALNQGGKAWLRSLVFHAWECLAHSSQTTLLFQWTLPADRQRLDIFRLNCSAS